MDFVATVRFREHQLLEEVAALRGGEQELRRQVDQVEVVAVHIAGNMERFELVIEDIVARLCTLEGCSIYAG